MDVQKLGSVAVASEGLALLYHFTGKVASYAGESVELGRIRLVDVQQGDVYICLQPFIDAVRYYITLAEIFLAAETSSLFPLIHNALGLLDGEAQTLQILKRGCVGVETEILNPAGQFLPQVFAIGRSSTAAPSEGLAAHFAVSV